MGERTCSVDGCERKHFGRGLCQMHYMRVRKTGSTEPRVFQPSACKVDGCERQANVPGSARGWCGEHYYRWKRWGDPVGAHQPTVGVAECSIDACTMLVIARGWCSKHWTRWDRYGDPEARMPGEVIDGRKICPDCGLDKPLSDYGCSRVYCKPCNATIMRTRREDPRQKSAEQDYYRRFNEANPGLMAERARSWRRRNPDQVRAATAARRARKAAATVEDFTPREIFERDAWVCGICGGSISPSAVYPDMMSASLDHVIPLARGGHHVRTNCQAAHLICNVRKGARVA